MRWFWQKATPAPSGECRHLWSNWSEPGQTRVTYMSFSIAGSDQTERDGWAQDRHCLNCNIYQRRVA